MTNLPRGTTVCSVGVLASLLLMLAASSPAPVAEMPVFGSSAAITNPFAPFQPNATKVFRGRLDGGRLVVIEQHSDETRTFQFGGQSVECCILVEKEFLNGSQVDTSVTYLGEDVDTNVYIFGEFSTTHENGVVVSHEGSWYVGEPVEGDPDGSVYVDQPFLFMPANPQVGDSFQPENIPGFEVETFTVLETGRKLKVDAGRYTNALKLREVYELSGKVQQHWIVPGVGMVRTRGKSEKLNLMATTLIAE